MGDVWNALRHIDQSMCRGAAAPRSDEGDALEAR